MFKRKEKIYEKINFENAEIINPAKVTIEGIDYEVTPAQLTVIEKYLSAENLNEMQDNIEESCVIVSPTQPTTNEKVWIQKGKNLFNKNNVVGNLSINAEGIFEQDDSASVHYIQVVLGKTYSISSNKDRQWVLNTSANKPSLNGSGSARTVTSGLTIEVTIPEGHNYLNIRNHPTSANEDSVNQNVQVEEGFVTEYEAYVEPKILCKNDNGEFEEFYNAKYINDINSKLDKSLMYRGWFNGEDLDFDDQMETGIYAYSGYKGKYRDNPIPYMGYGLVVVFSADGNYTTQIIFSEAGQGAIYIRSAFENRVYGEFRQIH